jgi:hypothetical protein
MTIQDLNFLDPKTLAEPFDFFKLARRQAPVIKVNRETGLEDIYPFYYTHL